jgi:hypothetical protein
LHPYNPRYNWIVGAAYPVKLEASKDPLRREKPYHPVELEAHKIETRITVLIA